MFNIDDFSPMFKQYNRLYGTNLFYSSKRRDELLKKCCEVATVKEITEAVLREGKIDVTLENIYGLLSVDLIDVTERQIGDFTYDIICDDEGLLVNECLPSAYNSKCQPQLVGNLLLVNHDEEGNFASLTDEQIEDLKKQLFVCVTEWNGKTHIYHALKGVEYV